MSITGRIPTGDMMFDEALAWLVSLGQSESSATGTLLVAMKEPRAIIQNGTIAITCPRKSERVFRATPNPAVALLEEAFFLRQNGEYAPGGNENWHNWDRKAETFLRGLLPPETGA
jgi:hypothetical protein